MRKKEFILTGTTLTEDVTGMAIPFTVTLKSAAGSRQIEFSTDSGIEYFVPVLDVTSATMLVATVLAPISHVKATGAINDTLIMVG